MLVGLQNSYLVLGREDVRIERGFSSRTRLVVFWNAEAKDAELDIGGQKGKEIGD